LKRAKTSTEERLARAEQLRQHTLPSVEFSERLCLLCGGGAHPISSVDLPAIMGRINGSVSYQDLVQKARRAGFTDDHCYTSSAGVSICKTERKR
jgi:hypothetical protein